jgi:homogentisate 1,2-dioxygenase
MPLYHKLGDFPQKRHTQFEKPTGGLYYEQLFGTEGFHGHASLLYHVHRPTQVKEITNPIRLSQRLPLAKT